MRDWPRDSMKVEKLEGELIVSILCLSRRCRGYGVRTQRYRLFARRLGFDPGSMLPPSIDGGNPRYCGTGSPRQSHSGERGAHLFVNDLLAI